MSVSARTFPIKSLLLEFVAWLEYVRMGIEPPPNAFGISVDAEIVAKAQEAVDLDQTSGEQLRLSTNGIPAQAVVANLVFHRVGFGAERMAKGTMTDADWEILTQTVGHLASSALLLVEDVPHQTGTVQLANLRDDK